MKWTIHSCVEFNQLSHHWQQLNQTGQNQPILTADFVSICLDNFATGNEIIAVCQDKTGPHAMGVFHRTGLGRYATFQPSQAPLGLFLSRDNQWNSSLLAGLTDALPGIVFMIDFLQQDTTFIEVDSSLRLITSPYITTGRLDAPKDFEQFFASLGKNMRQNYNKVVNRCNKQQITLDTQLITNANDITDAIKRYGEFESSGWKGQTGTAVNIDNQQGKFYQQLLSHYAQQDQTEIWHYKVDSEIVATDLCIKSNGILVILKTAYNEEFKKLSPALQLKFEIFRHHSQSSVNDVESIEFFGKAMEWHKRFNSQLREIEHLTYLPNALLQSLYMKLKRKD